MILAADAELILSADDEFGLRLARDVVDCRDVIGVYRVAEAKAVSQQRGPK